jgi:hypothetical protein
VDGPVEGAEIGLDVLVEGVEFAFHGVDVGGVGQLRSRGGRLGKLASLLSGLIVGAAGLRGG